MNDNGKPLIIPGNVPIVGRDTPELITSKIGGVDLSYFKDPQVVANPTNADGVREMTTGQGVAVNALCREAVQTQRELAGLRADIAELAALVDALDLESAGIIRDPDPARRDPVQDLISRGRPPTRPAPDPADPK